MSEIDVSKYKNCPYWHYGHCENNIINVLNSECSVHQNCFIKKTLEQLQQLKAENEELKEMNHGLSEKFANVCGGCFEQELREKYKQCLDEIEKICTHETINLTDSCINGGRYFEILQKIKEVKENV